MILKLHRSLAFNIAQSGYVPWDTHTLNHQQCASRNCL